MSGIVARIGILGVIVILVNELLRITDNSEGVCVVVGIVLSLREPKYFEGPFCVCGSIRNVACTCGVAEVIVSYDSVCGGINTA